MLTAIDRLLFLPFCFSAVLYWTVTDKGQSRGEEGTSEVNHPSFCARCNAPAEPQCCQRCVVRTMCQSWSPFLRTRPPHFCCDQPHKSQPFFTMTLLFYLSLCSALSLLFCHTVQYLTTVLRLRVNCWVLLILARCFWIESEVKYILI